MDAIWDRPWGPERIITDSKDYGDEREKNLQGKRKVTTGDKVNTNMEKESCSSGHWVIQKDLTEV